ncbi:APO protein 4, mitochondrial-like isoform X1 [Macadamia integrifolia]|uniref:APO protein 4, mitochondrial-like isoform X1 n=1 Tax=Macadamia integrifolia TaxID=60698 RepID=UPI001C4EC5DE|nr:APO protein 4, mitochondrial-like isoform X1 [Macadamia integrifolia]XP_042482006.1 APO protein 4, mitochondrial-like isoform X1 [Macadamia integrifolia]
MALKQKGWYQLLESFSGCQFYSPRMNWDELRPLIMERIKHRAKDYPVRALIPVANDVVKARALLIEGISTLIKFIPIKACKFCPELFIGENGHLIETCHGFRRRAKNQDHTWIDGTLNDILVPVETFHLQGVSQDVIKHDQKFDFERFPAVLELCRQAGANVYDECLYKSSSTSDNGKNYSVIAESLSQPKLTSMAKLTLEAWERLRAGVQKLLLVYPAKVCKRCSEVHVGPSGHKAQIYGVLKYEGRQGTHLWKKAKVDYLVPPNVVWRQRPQDPLLLLDNGRDFYGCAPAVIELCLQAGATIPVKYFYMMKIQG